MTFVLFHKNKCFYIQIIDFNVNGVHVIQKCVNDKSFKILNL